MGRKRKHSAADKKSRTAEKPSLGNSEHARRRRLRKLIGRPLGSPNINLREARLIVEQIVDGFADRIPGILDRIEKRDPAQAAQIWTRLLDFVVAKRAHVVVTPTAPAGVPIDINDPVARRAAYERAMRGEPLPPLLPPAGVIASHEPSTRATSDDPPEAVEAMQPKRPKAPEDV
jgi:hypothetical protein